MLILGIETSCDETAVSIVRSRTDVLSNIISSQVDFHRIFGGVVPEIASRKHLELINPALDLSMHEAGKTWRDLDAVAVTIGPGLVGSLAVGTTFAKALCLAHNLPLVAVNHLEGHLLSCFIGEPNLNFPYLCLIASGGHSDLVWVKEIGDYEVIGRTRDDAAGEAFDKVARALGLDYPGGPSIDKTSECGTKDAVQFPRSNLGDSLDFSFSGLKTAVVRYLKGFDTEIQAEQPKPTTADISASFQEAAVDMLVKNTIIAAKQKNAPTVAIAGGVAANRRLRTRMSEEASKLDFRLVIPEPVFCTDNAAMIACAGSFKFELGITSSLDTDVHAVLNLN